MMTGENTAMVASATAQGSRPFHDFSGTILLAGAGKMGGALGEISAAVIAVKPQVAPAAVPTLAPFVGAATVVVSIMAGRTLRFLEEVLPGAAIVRAMPNTPAAIGRGITVAIANARVSAKQRELVHALLAAVGGVEWVADEALMDAVTALSGSGPAYVFLLAEAMALGDWIAVLEHGRIVQHGPPRELASRPASPYVAELIGVGAPAMPE